MFQINILEDSDIITEDCFIRPLDIFYDNGYGSDYAGQESMYTGKPQNRMTWTEVSRMIPLWVGISVKEFNDREVGYLFCKGDLPNKLITPLTKSEFKETVYHDYLESTVLPFVKRVGLKGKTLLYIWEQAPDYYKYLQRNNSFTSLDESYRDYLNRRTL